MAKDRLQYLLKKKFAGQCSPAETEELARLIDTMNDMDLSEALKTQWNTFSSPVTADKENSRRILESILGRRSRPGAIHTGSYNQKTLRIRLVAAAASLIILAVLGSITSRTVKPAPAPAVVIVAEQIPASQPVSYNRYIELPDGSSVLLKARSTLESPVQFNGISREVTLNGEAYFDIARDTNKLFIIHTGMVKTVVLGTAFNIKAWDYENQVTVSVTRGKVKVENDEKVLAVLTANQQLQYDKTNSDTDQKDVIAEQIVTDWTGEDMVFKGESLESIARILSKRFEVNISISDPGLAGTVIVSSFSGTEPLENILEILCKINGNADFRVNGNEILVERK